MVEERWREAKFKLGETVIVKDYHRLIGKIICKGEVTIIWETAITQRWPKGQSIHTSYRYFIKMEDGNSIGRSEDAVYSLEDSADWLNLLQKIDKEVEDAIAADYALEDETDE